MTKPHSINVNVPADGLPNASAPINVPRSAPVTQPNPAISTKFAVLQIHHPNTTPPTLQIHQPKTNPTTFQTHQPSVTTATAYETTNSQDSDECAESPISRPGGWDSDDSTDDHCNMTRHGVKLCNEKRLRERADPIQAHLEFLHQAFRNVDPKFTVFAFGGTISSDQVDCKDCILRVWKDHSIGVVDLTAEIDAGGIQGPGLRNQAGLDTENAEKEGRGEPKEAVFQFPLIGEQVELLQKFASIAPFGKGNKTVYDAKYRKAMEITPDRFQISPDPVLVNNDILVQIARTSHLTCKLRAEISKLNIYTKGGFFKRHCDTPKSSLHIKTIVLSLPGAYSGGQLVVGHGGPAITFDWGMQRYEYERGTTPSSDIQVQKVHDGSRITIAYDVYTVPGPSRKQQSNQSQSDKIYRVLQEALEDRIGFAKDGCTLAVGLSHSYPKDNNDSLWKGLESRLKSPDAVLLQAIVRCGLSYSFKAAFRRRWESRPSEVDAGEYGIAREDKLSETTLNALYRNGMKRFQVILTDEPDAVEGKTMDTFESDGGYLFKMLDHNQEGIKQLVWVDYPQNYGFKNNYEFIGNGLMMLKRIQELCF